MIKKKDRYNDSKQAFCQMMVLEKKIIEKS